MRERCQCAVTERMCANNGRIYADNGQEMHRQRKWVRCLRELCRCSVRCECALTATETLRGEGMCANSREIYAETTFRECVHEHATTCTRLTWRNVSWLQARPLDRLQRCVYNITQVRKRRRRTRRGAHTWFFTALPFLSPFLSLFYSAAFVLICLLSLRLPHTAQPPTLKHTPECRLQKSPWVRGSI
jgi:hypothetical protein